MRSEQCFFFFLLKRKNQMMNNTLHFYAQRKKREIFLRSTQTNYNVARNSKRFRSKIV